MGARGRGRTPTARGLRVSGHIPAFMRAEDAVRQGFDEIQHINQVLLNFFVKPTDDTRDPGAILHRRRNAPSRWTSTRRGPRLHRALAARADRHRSHADGLRGPVRPAPGRDRIRATPRSPRICRSAIQRDLRTNSMDVNESNVDRYRKSYAKMVAFVGMMHRAGIPLVAGTDAMPGFALHRELELYVKAGIPPARGPADRDLERRQVHPHPRPAGLDRARQVGRPGPRRRRPDRGHLGDPPDWPGDEGGASRTTRRRYTRRPGSSRLPPPCGPRRPGDDHPGSGSGILYGLPSGVHQRAVTLPVTSWKYFLERLKSGSRAFLCTAL